MAQQFTSARTSRNQIPYLIKKVIMGDGTIHLDIGSGKYWEKLVDYTYKTYCAKTLVYDPYNVPKEINENTIILANALNVNTITCCNVLNVIKEKQYRDEIYKLALSVLESNDDKKGNFYISVYNGNKSGIGSETLKDSWQNNLPLKAYLGEVREYFPKAFIKGCCIVAFL